MHKLILNQMTNQPVAIKKEINADTVMSIPFDPANTDYANFKRDIADGAELQDADGNLMSADAAKAFVGTLP